MAEHNEFGKEGEEEAAAYLIDKGYSIRHRNWHCGKKELDIVAEYRNELIVIEVKTRKNTRFGNPEDAVTDKKIRRIIASTDAYLRKFSVDLPVRFDIITLVGEKTPFTIEHIEEAFVWIIHPVFSGKKVIGRFIHISFPPVVYVCILPGCIRIFS